MAIESIALIPSGVKATKVYSQLPVDGGGDFTFDRGTSTTQTRVNKDGLIEDVAQDVPRLDYLDGGCPSLLLEPASTNLITYSEDLSNAAYSPIRANVSVNQILSPDGSVNADKIVEDTTATNTHSNQQNVTVANGDLSYSVFIKKGERTKVLIQFTDLITGSIGVKYDLENREEISFSVGGSWTNGSYKVVDYGNDWLRFEVSGTSGAGTSVGCQVFLLDDDGNTSYTGDGTSGLYAWGFQLEQKSYATSYIPTSGSTETRAAEICNGAGTTDEINSQEGVLYFEGRAIADDLSYRVISLSNGGGSNRVVLGYNNSNNTIYTFMDSSSASQGNISYSVIDITDYLKVAVLYRENDRKFYVNGLLVGVDTSATMPTGLNELAFDSGTGGSPFYGRCKRLSVYDSALSDSELEALTGFSSFAEMASYLSYS